MLINTKRRKMKKVYYLSTCDTCKRIMKDLNIGDEFEKQDVKAHPLSESQIDELFAMAGSYENLINKRARKLKDTLVEHPVKEDKDYRKILALDYTFLKRPVFIVKNKIFIGNTKLTVEEVRSILS